MTTHNRTGGEMGEKVITGKHEFTPLDKGGKPFETIKPPPKFTRKHVDQFNRMLVALRSIGKGYLNHAQVKKKCLDDYGLEYEEALEMAYDNIQSTARDAIKRVKEIG